MTIHPRLTDGMKHGCFWITGRIAIGQFASQKRCEWLFQQGVTHLLNVGEAASQAQASSEGFRKVVDVPIVDLERIPDDLALRCIDAVHEAMAEPEAMLYVHCIAGQNRSPTVLWLYFLACGMDPSEAKRMIVEKSPDSIPGHKRLVDQALIALIQEYGASRKMAPKDPSVLEAAY